MKLKQWLKSHKVTQAKFAAMVGSFQGHVSNWVNEKVVPELASMLRVKKVTKGKVDLPDWVKK